jgi:predicted metal-binding membrane protein
MIERSVASTAALALAGACWIVAIHQSSGMDMGASTELGSFTFFVAAWASMMGAMMLPGAVPAVSRLVRADGRLRALPQFVGSYIVVWTVVGLAVYAVYRPHNTSIAGVLVIAAGAYELSAFKRDCRRRCRESVSSGSRFGLYCIGSSIGLMVMLVALGVMSVFWMAVVAAVVFVQKLLPPRAPIDVPLALAIVGLGVLILVTPETVPGLTQAM